MALDFPSSPSLNQIISSEGLEYIWNGTAWVGYSSEISYSQADFTDIDVVDIDVSGITTSVNLDVTNGTIDYLNSTQVNVSGTTTSLNLDVTNGSIDYFSATQVNVSGTSTSTNIDVTNGTIDYFSAVQSNVSGTTTSLNLDVTNGSIDYVESTQVNVSGTTTSLNLDVTNGTIDYLNSTQSNVSGTTTSLNLDVTNGSIDYVESTQVNVSGLVTATTFDGNLTGNVVGNLTGNVNSSGVSTFSSVTINNQLSVSGGGVDVTGHTETDTLRVSGVSTFQGNIDLGDGDRLRFGDSQDLQIYSDGVHSFIQEQGTGSLFIDTNSIVNIRKNSSEDIAKFNVDGAVELYYDNSKKFETTGVGVTVFGTTESQQLVVTGVSTFQGNVNLDDNYKLQLGNDADLQIWSDNTDQYIRGEQNQLIIRSNNLKLQSYLGENYIHATNNNAVSIYYDNSKKFETTTAGVDVTGHTETDSFRVSGVSTFQGDVFLGDGDSLYFGDGNDLRIYHTGSNSVIQDSGSGSLFIQASPSIRITDPSANAMAVFNDGGSVELYHNNLKKFETASGGVNATGQIGLSGELILNTPSDKYIDFYTKDGGGTSYSANLRLINDNGTSIDNAITMIRDGAVQIYHAGNKKFETILDGVDITGHIETDTLRVSGVSTFQSHVHLGDDDILYFGAGDDLEIKHIGGSFNNIQGSAELKIQSASQIQLKEFGTSEVFANFIADGSVELYYDNSKKIETTGAGVTVFGTTETQQLVVSGVSTFSDNVSVAGTITELFSGTYWNVVTQVDIGSDPNQISLNQYLGQLAFLDDFSPNGLRRDGGGSDDVSVDSNGNVSIGNSLSVTNDISVGVSTAHGVILTSPNGSKYRLIVDDSGNLSTTAV